MPAETPRPAADELEPTDVRPGSAGVIVVGLFAFLALALAVLGLYFHLEIPSPGSASPKPFPGPQLETSIDPRSLPADLPGPAAPQTPTPPRLDEALIARAMATIAAKGEHAYDPLPAPASTAGAKP